MWDYEHDHEQWQYNRPPPPPPPPPRYVPNPYRRSAHLSPDPPFDSSLHRSRSYGHGPRPEINIYNYQDQHNDQDQRTSPPPPVAMAPVYEAASRGRQEVSLADQLLTAEIAGMRLDRIARSSRSRGRSDAQLFEHHYHHHTSPPPVAAAAAPAPAPAPVAAAPVAAGPSSDIYKWQVEQLEREKREAEQRRYWDARRRIDAEEAEAERKRIIDEHDRAAAVRAARQRDEEQKLLDKIERDKREAKAEEKRIVERYEREQREQEEREEAALKEFERKRKERIEAEEKKKKAEQEKLETEMRNRLLKAGYSLEDAEVVLSGKKSKKKSKSSDENVVVIEEWTTIVHGQPLAPPRHVPQHVPIYPRIHKKYLDTQTLIYYQIPYEFDRANGDYIVILREMSNAETEELFDHTRRLRKRQLLLEPAPKRGQKQFAFVRPKRDRSRSAVKRDIRIVQL
ncbi:hypothetical protein AAFC00_005478 [Neodothiora populina]|uniref:Uncharacterized protein n=1 Tax=Neodothiora populina TaxID=2781224 RepID=A0ABR3PKZ6_9PEZI